MVWFILTSLHASAQLTVRRLPTSPEDRANFEARTQSTSPVSLPFWDDFSYKPDTLWSNRSSVLINNGIGIHPPSIGVATFDGLNGSGVPYDPNDVLLDGYTDSLTSRPIKMTAIPPQQRDSVYLSFYYQWKGNREAPDPNDFLELQFLNGAGKWVEQFKISTSEKTLKDSIFYDTLIKVIDTAYYHDTFQFRFRAHGRLSGPYDSWNVDYVYMNMHRTGTDTSFPDRAISTPPTHLFKPYTAIPISHFTTATKVNKPQFDVYNLRDAEATTLSYLPRGKFYTFKDGVVTKKEITLGDTTPINIVNGVLFALERKTVTIQHPPDPGDATQFDLTSDSIKLRLKVHLFSGDVVNIHDGTPSPDYKSKYIPIDFRSNDTTSSVFILKDYYAYDDGTAEYAAGLTQPGNRAALRFDMNIPEGDTLTGLEIQYPYFGGTTSTTVEFTVYADNNGVPGNSVGGELIPVRLSGLNKFTKVTLQQARLVPSTFYIGWQEPVGGNVFIGLDKSNDTFDRLFVNTNGTWVQNTDVHGSLMIRPVFGKGNIVTGLPENTVELQPYPNPSRGTFYLPGNVSGLEVIASDGRRVSFTSKGSSDVTEVSLINPVPGLYLLRYGNANRLVTKKILVIPY